MDGNLTHHHGAQDLAESLERAAQAVVNLARAEVHHHLEIGETHVHQAQTHGDLVDPPVVNQARVDQGVN